MSQLLERRNQTASPDYHYVIGVDLGTTNSAAAYVDLTSPNQRAIHVFQIPQFVAERQLGQRRMLPSFLYLPGEYDLPPGSTALPWDEERSYIVGEFAREQGSRLPGRLVSSAKSWLCHAGVDRTAEILPWDAAADVAKVSPVEASARYLLHIREAWNAEVAAHEDDEVVPLSDSASDSGPLSRRFEDQLIVLTVPASFDEVARELTLAAARGAGMPNVVLLEEPLAAFYAWLSAHEQSWQQQMQAGQLILVCDVGGGTSDFSIVGIRDGATGLRFDRLAVGEHLLLGGDNMDLTLGRHIEAKLMGQPGKLDAQRWHQLVYQCRQAKETLLTRRERPQQEITILGTAGQLIGGTRKTSLTQEEVQQLILEGFFPQVAADARPTAAQRSGLTELGLPYVQDPAITRHLAAFWRGFQPLLQEESGRTTPYPDFVLFNGGTLVPSLLRDRIKEVVGSWFATEAGTNWTPVELNNPQPELAVSIGAAYFGLVRLGMGVRVGSGSPRAFYVGVESQSEPTQQGHTAVCLIPRGVEEGFEAQLRDLTFQARANQPVAFQLYSSSTRLGDKLGEVVKLPADEVTVLPSINTVLRYGRRANAVNLPVQLGVRLTEIGTLELWCESQQSEHRWQLQFDVRQAVIDADEAPAITETIDQSLIEEAQRLIHLTFGSEGERQAHPPEQLRRALEETLTVVKEEWPTPLIRTLADALLDAEAGRAISAEHEARWFNLLGFCLRPGYGAPVDDWRMKRIWQLHFQGLNFPRQAQNRTEWWIFWRRVAGGLKAGHQMEIYNGVRGYLVAGAKQKRRNNPMFPSKLSSGEELEIWLALANLEWLPVEAKVELGRTLLSQFGKNPPRSQQLWALSRFGARTPVYGPLDRLIPAAEAETWLRRLLALELEPNSASAHALVLLARRTGDRGRDLSEEARELVAQWLQSASERGFKRQQLLDLLQNPQSTMQKEEQEWLFGESLPAGLALPEPSLG